MSSIDGVGDIIAKEWVDTFNNPIFVEELNALEKEITIPKTTTKTDGSLNNLTFVITGSLTHFSNRDELVEFIESHGGKVVKAISNKVNYLINNDITSTSTKNREAKELNIPIISEEDFLNLSQNE